MRTPTGGFTIFMCIGKYGGFYAKAYKTGTCRVCLGWIAITLCFYDFENNVENIFSENKELTQAIANLKNEMK